MSDNRGVNFSGASKACLSLERQAGYPDKRIGGTDEVGRGCLAGPVVAAVVVLPQKFSWETHSWLSEVKDSKLIKPLQREKLASLIKGWALASAIGFASVEEIDRLNILNASHLAMHRALQQLEILPDHLLVDGKLLPTPPFSCPATPVIKGDQLSLSIGAASILAKVWRDQYMVDLDQSYPGYHLAQHKGYPTLLHQEAIGKKGLAFFHRKSFRVKT